jgi:hypothetical protein
VAAMRFQGRCSATSEPPWPAEPMAPQGLGKSPPRARTLLRRDERCAQTHRRSMMPCGLVIAPSAATRRSLPPLRLGGSSWTPPPYSAARRCSDDAGRAAVEARVQATRSKLSLANMSNLEREIMASDRSVFDQIRMLLTR